MAVIRGMHHAGISTPNLERCLSFYRDLLGFQFAIEVDWADSPQADRIVGLVGSAARGGWLKVGNTYIEVWEYLAPPGRPPVPDTRSCDAGIRHLCFDVLDIDAEYERLRAAGVEFFSAPQSMYGFLRSVYGRDPDGNIFELQEILIRDHPQSLDRLEFLQNQR